MGKLFMLGMAAMMILLSCVQEKTGLVKTNDLEFRGMVRRGEVDKITVLEKDKEVRVYLTPEALKKYIESGKRGFEKVVGSEGPHLVFKITSGYAFSEQMNEFYKENPDVKKPVSRFLIVQ